MGAIPLQWAWASLPSAAVSSITLFILLVSYGFLLAVYRLTIHPLARFPGPKLSAATGWYECYLDIFRGPGKTFAFEIERMHERYGPIVRINPHEIHVSDPDFFDTLYAGGSAVRGKYAPAAHVQGTPEGIFGTVDHNAHRRRRQAISSYFSKQSVLQDQKIVDDKIELLCDFFRQKLKEGKEVNIRVPLLAVGTDVFCAHTLGERGSMDLLRDWDRAVEWRQSIIALLHWTPVVRQFPWVIPFAIDLPVGLINVASKEMGLVVSIFRVQARSLSFHNSLRVQAAAAIAEHDQLQGEHKARANVFHTILSSNLTTQDKDVKRMAQEGFGILSASGDTIARSMTMAMYYLHADPHSLERLKDELKIVLPDPQGQIDLATLERLPWLTAVLKESLRIAALITTRAPLTAPTEWLRYGDWAIPPNTPISMTLSSLMMNPETFPSPDAFQPERWLESNPDYKKNMSYFVAFHKGHRNCIGINLAWCQMYFALAKMIRRFDFELYGVVKERDIDYHRDCFLGEPRDDTMGVRMRVISEDRG
ncbi:cytochrome P450 [Massariosphaeria phaeospora]|uniref:Cytochrome P450 n=1 Tax=Massariosphaeria phaeospora TaxID=100035 RepID=A0A7C8IDH5_9PLEO|nr:cytochrome P450 [Massariosphaeria phaeospora]